MDRVYGPCIWTVCVSVITEQRLMIDRAHTLTHCPALSNIAPTLGMVQLTLFFSCNTFLTEISVSSESSQGSVLHRVQPGGWVQGGDIVTGAGDGSRSVYVWPHVLLLIDVVASLTTNIIDEFSMWTDTFSSKV